MSYSKILIKAFFLFLLTVLLGSCTYTVVPQEVPPLQGYKKVSDASVALVNAEKINSEILIFHSRKGKFYGNPRVWTENFINALSRELTKCGISVNNNAPLKVKKSLEFDYPRPKWRGITPNSWLPPPRFL